MTQLLYPTFSKVDKMKGFVKVLAPLFDDVLGRFLVDDGAGNWIPLPDTPAIILGNSNVPSPDYPRIILNFVGTNDLDGAQIDAGTAELPNPNHNPDDPDSPATIFVPYNTKYLRYIVSVRVESGNIDEVYRGDRLSSDDIVVQLLTKLLTDPVRQSINEYMTSSIAQTNTVVPQVAVDNTTYHDTSTVLLLFHTMTTNYNYSTGVFDSVEIDYELHRGGDTENPDPNPITGSITVDSSGVNTP